MKTQAGCRLSSLKTQLNAVRRSNACKVLGGTEYLEDEAMDNPLISVIIPVYNVEKYLRECVDSVLKQTYDNFEIILIDDGSTDSSGKICDGYTQNYKRIKCIHTQNQGPSSARTIGIERALGEYIYFLDSDDYIDCDALRILEQTAKDTDSDIVFFEALSFAENQRDRSLKQSYVYKKDYGSDSGFEMFKRLQTDDSFHVSIPMQFFKRSFLKEKKPQFIQGIYHEDMVFTFEAFFLASKITHCHRQLYFRRYRELSIMTSEKSEKYFISLTIVYKALCDFLKLHKNDSIDTVRFTDRCAYNALDVYKKLDLSSRKKNRTVYTDFKQYLLHESRYSSKELKLKCRSVLLWTIYKAYQKIFGW